jgi:hypothetical protein
MPNIARAQEAKERLENLRSQRFVYISDGSSGGEKVGQALAAFRVIVPALEALVADYISALNMAEMLKKDLPDSQMDALIESICEIPPVMTQDRLSQLFARISEVD